MTICVATLAANFKAIVCVADKALSYGDQIQWDSDGSKIIKINPSGTLLMFSGDELPISKLITALRAKGKDLWYKERSVISRVCEEEYNKVFEQVAEAKYLTPRLLQKYEYVDACKAPETNDLIRGLADELSEFELDCALIVCGFDRIGTPFIFHVVSPGIATDMTMTGFHAIGCAWDKAVARLLFSEHKRTHSIERSLFDAFDSKAFAEMAQGVGYEWDAVVVMENGFHDVPEEVRKLIEKVWARANRSPFDRYNPKEDEKGPPKDWQKILADFTASLPEKPRPFTAQSAD